MEEITCRHSCVLLSVLHICRKKQILVCPFNLMKKASLSASYSVHQQELSAAFSAGYSAHQQELTTAFPTWYSTHQEPFATFPAWYSTHQQELVTTFSTWYSAHHQELSAAFSANQQCNNTAKLFLNANFIKLVTSIDDIQNLPMSSVEVVNSLIQMVEINEGLLAFDYYNKPIGHCVCFQKIENQLPLIWDAQKKALWSEDDNSHIKKVYCYEVNTEVISRSETCDCLPHMNSTNGTILGL